MESLAPKLLVRVVYWPKTSHQGGAAGSVLLARGHSYGCGVCCSVAGVTQMLLCIRKYLDDVVRGELYKKSKFALLGIEVLIRD